MGTFYLVWVLATAPQGTPFIHDRHKTADACLAAASQANKDNFLLNGDTQPIEPKKRKLYFCMKVVYPT